MEEKKEPEPSSYNLSNPGRVTQSQEGLVTFLPDQRYVPVRKNAKAVGIVLLLDRNPEEPEDVAQVRGGGS